MKPFSIQEGVLLKDFSTYQIGGPARYMVIAHDKEELSQALKYANDNNLRYICIGKGSNALFDDRGFDGLVIVNKIDTFAWEENRVRVGGGFSFSLLGSRTAREGFAGLEFASGIPGSVGGAIYMNAGAGFVETKDALVEVEYMHINGELEVFKRSDIEFAYRYSMFQDMEGVIVSAVFALRKDEAARKNQTDLFEHRMKTQPYKERSCGCVFRNPEKVPAGKLIEECGLKGMECGGAVVSPMHANFIVNQKGASSQDVLDLMAYIQLKVFHTKGIELESEIQYIPYQLEDDGSEV